jgi:hypothetical protein
MKKILLASIIFFSFSIYGQQNKVDKNFIKDFTKALDKNFTEEKLNKMFQDYSALLTPSSDVTQLTEKLQGRELAVYPLYDFKSEKLYTDNIENLLNSKNDNQRILAYLVIGSSGDTSKEKVFTWQNKNRDKQRKFDLGWHVLALFKHNPHDSIV